VRHAACGALRRTSKVCAVNHGHHGPLSNPTPAVRPDCVERVFCPIAVAPLPGRGCPLSGWERSFVSAVAWPRCAISGNRCPILYWVLDAACAAIKIKRRLHTATGPLIKSGSLHSLRFVLLLGRFSAFLEGVSARQGEWDRVCARPPARAAPLRLSHPLVSSIAVRTMRTRTESVLCRMPITICWQDR